MILTAPNVQQKCRTVPTSLITHFFLLINHKYQGKILILIGNLGIQLFNFKIFNIFLNYSVKCTYDDAYT